MSRSTFVHIVVVIVALAAGAAPARSQPAGEQPETVLITLHAKAGAIDSLADVVAKHYETARRLNLLAPAAPHLTLQAKDADNQAYLVEILTWRDGSIPDHAPADIQAIWKEMNALVEPRSGRPGLDIVEVVPVTRGK